MSCWPSCGFCRERTGGSLLPADDHDRRRERGAALGLYSHATQWLERAVSRTDPVFQKLLADGIAARDVIGSMKPLDAYMSGFCHRCGRSRVECQRIIDSGKRCTEVPR